jgi:hypothetical protein
MGDDALGKASRSSLRLRAGLSVPVDWTTEAVESAAEMIVGRFGRPVCLNLLSVNEVAFDPATIVDERVAAFRKELAVMAGSMSGELTELEPLRLE